MLRTRSSRRTRLWLRTLEDRTVPATFTVTNLQPNGIGSLREAINLANDNPGADTINFTVTGTIQPDSLPITDAITINGPGAGLLTLDGDGNNRLMNINIPAAGAVCNISGLSFINGVIDSMSEYGGAISAQVDQLMLNGCAFTNNNSVEGSSGISYGGGALFFRGSLTAVDCSFTNNSSVFNGGAVDGTQGNATFQHCAFTGNKTHRYVGGAVSLSYYKGATFDSCSLYGNTAPDSTFGDGGGIYSASAPLTLRNCTIASNSAGHYAGGVVSGGPLLVQNSTFSDNHAVQTGAIRASFVSIESSILFGDYDDVFSSEVDGFSCTAVKSLIGTIRGVTTFSGDTFSKTNIGVNPLLLPLGNYSGTMPTIAFRSNSPAIDQGSNPAGLTSDGRGTGFVRVSGAAPDIGAYEQQATNLKVLTDFDSGAGTLRQAMIDAQANPNPFDVITFDPTFFATPRTITLVSALPTLTHELQLVGPGSDKVTVRRSSSVGPFSVFSFPNATTVVMSGLKISGGDTTASGGGIAASADGAALTLDHVVVTGNNAQTGGGGVYVSGKHSRLTLLDTTVANNSATGVGGGVAGEQAYLDIERSTISGNTANGGGGVSVIRYHYANGVDFTMINSTVSGNNSTNAPGGGIRFNLSPSCTILNSTIHLNTCGGAGGGIGVVGVITFITATSTIISGNTASSAQDISDSGLAVSLDHCAVGNMQGFTFNNFGGNLFGASLNLGALADNGGPTKTHALLLGSAAIDAGANTANLTTDQRGGQFVRVAGAPDIGAYEVQNSFFVTNANDSGPGSLRQALLDSNKNAGPDIVFIGNVFNTIKLTTGEIPISDPVSIIPQSTLFPILVSGNNASRIFNTQSAPANTAISIVGLTISGGSSANGGAILGGDESISLNNCTFTGNNAIGASAGGGAIVMLGGTLSATNCSFTNNTAGNAGGAILARKTILENCTTSGNTATNGWGGGVYVYGSSTDASSYLLAENCTFSGNKSKGIGGALNIGYFTAAGTATIRNCTISGNSANEGGGISLYSFNGTLAVQNSTIAANSATSKAGAIERVNGTGIAKIDSSILFGDTAPTGPEIFTTGTVIVSSSLVASKSGATVFTADAFTNANLGKDPLLGPLANNGGPTQTRVLLAGSPAIDHGSNPALLTNDQRGTSFARLTGPQVDIGAYEVQPDFVVRNFNDSGTGSLRQAVLNANAFPGADVITFDPSFFALPQLGSYTIKLTTGEIAISDAVTILGPLATTIINGNTVSRIFNMQSAPANAAIAISNLTFAGGASNGNGGAIIAGNQQLTFSNCTFTGNAANGLGTHGGAVVAAGSLSATDCTFTNNTAAGGGAISVGGTGATTTLTRCAISGNTTTFGGNGGGVETAYALLIENSTLSGNKAAGSGGAIHSSTPSNVTIRNSTISGNSGNSGGGWNISGFGGPPFNVQIQNCTITGNLANNQGGAVAISGTGTVTIESSILFADSAPTGPEVSRTGAVTANTSLISSTAGVTTFTGDAFTNANLGQNPNLGPLANNGGPTMTHALGVGSPAINNGSNPAGLTMDQRGTGFFRVNGGKVDIGAFESQTFAPAKVASVTVNDGSAQRSRVTSVAVAFDSPVTLPANPAEAFQLNRQSDGAMVGLNANVTGNTVTLSFSSGPLDFGSLADGRYTLTVLAANVNSGCFDGNGDSIGGDDFVLVGSPTTAPKLFRLFGDADGNGTVTAADFNAFRLQYGQSGPSIFDFNADDQVSASDFNQFRTRYGVTVAP